MNFSKEPLINGGGLSCNPLGHISRRERSGNTLYGSCPSEQRRKMAQRSAIWSQIVRRYRRRSEAWVSPAGSIK